MVSLGGLKQGFLTRLFKWASGWNFLESLLVARRLEKHPNHENVLFAKTEKDLSAIRAPWVQGVLFKIPDFERDVSAMKRESSDGHILHPFEDPTLEGCPEHQGFLDKMRILAEKARGTVFIGQRPYFDDTGALDYYTFHIDGTDDFQMPGSPAVRMMATVEGDTAKFLSPPVTSRKDFDKIKADVQAAHASGDRKTVDKHVNDVPSGYVLFQKPQKTDGFEFISKNIESLPHSAGIWAENDNRTICKLDTGF